MVQPLANSLLEKIRDVSQLYHRLILLIGSNGTGKTAILREVSDEMGTPVVNVNLELSQQMLELTERQRILQVSGILGDIIGGTGRDTVLLDNTEILFDITLQQDPLRLLQGLSRNKTIVAAWNGSIDGNKFVYAEPGHPEYRRYSAKDVIFLTTPQA